MADTLKLKRSSTELNLLAAKGAGLRVQKWLPKMADILYSGIPPYPMEAMDVLIDRTSYDNLATSMQALDQMRHWAVMYRDKTIQEPVWLHAKMDGETGERRAHIQALSGEWRSDQVGPAGYPAASNALIQLQVKRHPYWEPLTHTVGTALTSAVGTVAINHAYGSPVGDVGARVREVSFVDPVNHFPDYGLDRLWIGLRSTKFGTPGNLVSIWEWENVSGELGADTTRIGDVNASPGGGTNDALQVSFATTPGWAWRGRLEVQDVTSDYTDQFGNYLWLLRGKVASGTTAEVQLRWGSSRVAVADSYLIGPTVEVTNSAEYDYFEMGQAHIPSISLHMEYASVIKIARYFTVEVWARRTAGSGNLYLDCTCPIPIDEGSLIIKDAKCITPQDYIKYLQAANDEGLAVSFDETVADTPSYWPEWTADNFRFPPGSGVMVVVYARPDSSVLADTLKIPTIHWYPRWVNLRGSE